MYPAAFADAICKLFPKLLHHPEGKPQGTREDGVKAFSQMRWSDWSDAGLMPVLRYLRGSKNLQVPPDWKATFPRAVEILHQKDMQPKVF